MMLPTQSHQHPQSYSLTKLGRPRILNYQIRQGEKIECPGMPLLPDIYFVRTKWLLSLLIVWFPFQNGTHAQHNY